MLKAITRSAELVDKRLASINRDRESKGQHSLTVANYFDHHATNTDTQVSVTEDDFIRAKDELAPSVSLDELRHYERVRNNFEGTTKKISTESQQQNDGGSISPTKLQKFIKYANENGGKAPTVNGSKSSRKAFGDATGGASDGDEDFVIRTDQVSLNNNNDAARPPSSKGKGKGKSRDVSFVEHAPDTNGEDLYD